MDNIASGKFYKQYPYCRQNQCNLTAYEARWSLLATNVMLMFSVFQKGMGFSL